MNFEKLLVNQSSQYADFLFDFTDVLKNDYSYFNVDEMAAIPFHGRRKELLSLGEVTETGSFPDDISIMTISYKWREGKSIKIYSVPNVRIYCLD